MSKEYHYCYMTTNLVTGKKYVGDHSTNNLDDGYLGSGNLIKHAIKKYGKENFKREILEICESKQVAFDLQETYINEYNTLSPNGYNISPKGGHNVKGCLSESSKLKISKSNKGRITWMKGKTHTLETKEKLKKSKTEDHKKRIGESKKGNLNFLGKKHTTESKIKISKSNKGKKRSPEVKHDISKRISGDGNPMYNKSVYEVWLNKFGKDIADKKKKETNEKISKSLSGLKRSKESKEKYKNAALNRIKIQCPYCLKQYDAGNYKQFHGEKCKSK